MSATARSKNTSASSASGPMHSDRAIRVDANVIQICTSVASLRTMRSRAAWPLALTWARRSGTVKWTAWIFFLFPLFAALVQRRHPNPTPLHRHITCQLSGPHRAREQDRSRVVSWPHLSCLWGPSNYRLCRPASPPRTCSVNCAVRF
jgi:hypothetical protein